MISKFISRSENRRRNPLATACSSVWRILYLDPAGRQCLNIFLFEASSDESVLLGLYHLIIPHMYTSFASPHPHSHPHYPLHYPLHYLLRIFTRPASYYPTRLTSCSILTAQPDPTRPTNNAVQTLLSALYSALQPGQLQISNCASPYIK